MKGFLKVFVVAMFLLVAGCIQKFTPNLHTTQYYLVVTGLITDQPEIYTVKLFWSITPGETASVPVSGCDVSVYDDLGHVYQFTESSTPGYYNSDSSEFRGETGRSYTLHIETNNATSTHYTYESEPVEMKKVPSIDSLYSEKVVIRESTATSSAEEGCQIYLDTYDPTGNCKFFRWDYVETWRFKIPWEGVFNKICWVSDNSSAINIKSTGVLSQDRIEGYPINFISNQTDRLSERYSILVNQYSISESEYLYWEQVKNLTNNNGGLYDIIPFSVTGNLFCMENPDENVLGYFSVSAKTSKRIYVEDTFKGITDMYASCPADTFYLANAAQIPGLNQTRWIIYECHGSCGDVEITTNDHGCADCTIRGTIYKPDFWEDSGKK
jgi:hypothetical protein